ncbi:DMT family protein [Candidatus Obscuribacterales bacterium]|nr:DMT family protein [Candidatus Obscuribacterales bacterium]MBX3138462.1 DMT family protein [Candidatus Obscuribacterales bacterium]MBX3151319.1 DMT family protein [Candidatus Obscuribacterales bacterium]
MQATSSLVLLLISNIFMTFAWYGHLKFKAQPLWRVIVISWLIASLEYCFQVPANRIGSYVFTTAQLKVIQEVITLSVFAVFSIMYLKEQFRWNYLVAFAFIIGAVVAVFYGDPKQASAVTIDNSKQLPPQSAH